MDEDSTPPPMKKQRKSSSSDSDFYETQSANKTNESKPDEQIASTSLAASTPRDDENEAGPSRMERTESEEQLQDDEMMGKHAAVEQRPKPNLPTSPTSLSNSSSVSTGSSPDTHSLPINTSTEHELSIEKDIERKFLQKIEYHLMEIFQHLEENETATESTEPGSSRYTQSKNNCTSDTSNTSGGNITATSHKISSANSSVADDDIANEPGPPQ